MISTYLLIEQILAEKGRPLRKMRRRRVVYYARQLWFQDSLGREVCTEGHYRVHFSNSLGLRVGGNISRVMWLLWSCWRKAGPQGIAKIQQEIASFEKMPFLTLPHFAKWSCWSLPVGAGRVGVLPPPHPLTHRQACTIS